MEERALAGVARAQFAKIAHGKLPGERAPAGGKSHEQIEAEEQEAEDDGDAQQGNRSPNNVRHDCIGNYDSHDASL